MQPDIVQKVGKNGPVIQGYDNVPMLKQPKWGWEIAVYFFCEGVSAGSYLLATLAELFGKGRFRRLTRAGYLTSFATLLPCPPLLIADLGRPARFHHMLRVVKPTSPMNLGAWALSGYGAAVVANTALQIDSDTNAMVPASTGALGLPFALTMLSYPGVLLATTSTPVWSKSRFLGALMATSSVSTGAAATSLALALSADGDLTSQKALAKIQTTAHIAESAALVAYVVSEGEAARPLLKREYKWHFWVGAVGVGLVVPSLIARRSNSRTARVIGSALTLFGGLALKWAITHAGKKSAVDNRTAREATRPSKSAPGWSQNNSGLARL
jgi:formate-dependent nitrite reductase membrane component NrfD